jgi:hypothetical protein
MSHGEPLGTRKRDATAIEGAPAALASIRIEAYLGIRVKK